MDASSSTGSIRRLMERFDGRFSSQVGIDVDHSDHEVERWFLASTLFGNRIDSRIAIRTYRVLDGLGLSTIDDVAACDRDRLVEFLDRGGYVRYDYRMASRLLTLADSAERLLPGGISVLGHTSTDPERLRQSLEALPGWGPVTTRSFLRELRGVWPGADLPIDLLAARSALHLGPAKHDGAFDIEMLRATAADADVDVRDLEAALVRLAFAHHRSFDLCEARSPGRCELLTDPDPHASQWRTDAPGRSSPSRVIRIESRRSIPRIVVPRPGGHRTDI